MEAARARRIEGCDKAVKSTHEAMRLEAGVSVTSGDRPHRVDAGRKCAIDSAWDIERGDSAVLFPHEPVIHTARVGVISGDGPPR